MAVHPLNRHLFIADNINLLRSLDNESIDLICIDPPFAKNQTFIGNLRPPLSDEERQRELDTLRAWDIYNEHDAVRAGIDWPDSQDTGRFRDIWRWESDVHEEWLTRIEDDYPALASVIDTTRTAHSEGAAAYLTYMAIRIIEMHRILKSTGSIYLHCDSSANSYLRMTLDSIFGEDNFKAEIVWQRTTSHSDARRLGRVHDYILFYCKGSTFTWNSVYQPLDSDYVENYYRYKDGNGRRFMSADLSGGGQGPERDFGERGMIAPPPGRHWMYDDDGIRNLIETDKIYWTRNGVPRLKVYLDEHPGMPARDVWTDILPLRSWHKERTGYPTQKPVALAERIVLASSNPGDVVLDCFAGCAYVPVAAERNGRQWIACDMSPRALTVLRRQFAKFNYAVDGEQQTDRPLLVVEADITTRGPSGLPDRTDEDPAEPQEIKELPPRRFKVPASIIPHDEMLEMLLELSGYTAWCCGFANRMPNGTIIRTTRNFHLDHIDPKSRDGSNDIHNRAPLCQTHNMRKRDRRVHLADYRREIADAGEMMVNTTSELINLAEAHHAAMQMYGRAYAARYGAG